MTTIRVLSGNLDDVVVEWIEYDDEDCDEDEDEDCGSHGEMWEKEGFLSDLPRDIPDLVMHLFDSHQYHALDGWRGYMEAKPNEELLVHLDLGFNWLAGHHSEEMQTKKLNLFRDAVKQLDLTVFLVTNRTGNFSAYTDVFVKNEDADTFQKISKFINDFVGDRDPRWDVGVLMHFDSDHSVGQSAIADLSKQVLPEWWNWQMFIEKYDILENSVDAMEIKPSSDLDDKQQVGLLAGIMLSPNPIMSGLAKLLVEMKARSIANKDQD